MIPISASRTATAAGYSIGPEPGSSPFLRAALIRWAERPPSVTTSPPEGVHRNNQEGSARSPTSAGGGWAGPVVILSAWTSQLRYPSQAIVVGLRRC
jgi:hypothetical protein